MKKLDLEKKENIEINFWRDSPEEGPSKFTKANFLNKTQEASHLDYKLQKYKSIINNKTDVLEIGAGQGWASCFTKKYYLPFAKFTVTDISSYAVDSIKYWEDIYKVKIDQSLACKSYEIPIADASFDLIFCYAAFHHFVKHKETLAELKRLLKPNGHIIFLYEPTSSSLFYKLYYKYVNWAPHSTPEDVIVPKRVKKMCKDLNLYYVNKYDSHQTINRSLVTTLYFKFLKTFSFLKTILPSSSDLLISNSKIEI
ncbi:MAG: class I SAM-dependent methyltransferase [Saprospiraceae bacterium]|nr:class I SAM-dependent methyltransferase [Bacteroidia bacterium]NNE14771.1 class I SAM-dependent methyltransferase [Saprospiraceae bacterium]NNL93200.1 class I SAM-dependent methyltransferase [Saprospiraceae bacterium]